MTMSDEGARDQPLIEVNNARYESIASQFVTDYLADQLEILHDLKVIDVTVEPLSDLAEDLIFQLGFFGMAKFEAFGAVDADGEKWFAHVLFGPRPRSPATLLASSKRTGLHGSVDDSEITEAVKRARDRVKGARR